jgi:hypothetical protein
MLFKRKPKPLPPSKPTMVCVTSSANSFPYLTFNEIAENMNHHKELTEYRYTIK